MRHGPTFGRHVRVLRGQGKGDRIDQETRVTFWVVLSLFSWNGPSGSFAVPGLVLCEFAGPCPKDQKEFTFDSCWLSNVVARGSDDVCRTKSSRHFSLSSLKDFFGCKGNVSTHLAEISLVDSRGRRDLAVSFGV